MKNFKKILSLFLALIMIVMTLVACGSSTPSATADSTSDQSSAATDSTPAASDEVKLPDVQLKNKTIVVYNFSDNVNDWRGTAENPGPVYIMEKEYGAQFKVVAFSDWAKQYEKLATLKMSNDMPDLLMQCDFPVAIGNGLCQPTEKYIDYSNPRWDNARPALEANKWNGHYYICNTSSLSSADWTYFNPQFFEANNMKSPLDYYKENAWDWNAVLDIAKQTTIDTDGDGKIDQWGLGMSSTADLHTQTGVPLVQIVDDGSVKLNLRDPKIEAAANFYRSLGPAGHNVLLNTVDEMTNAKSVIAGKMALAVVGWWVGVQDGVKDGFKNGTLDFVPMPKWPGEATNYIASQMVGSGIASNAKNPEGAALFLEVMAYTGTDAYREKYMPDVDPTIDITCRDAGMNAEQLKRLYDMKQAEKTMPVNPVRHWIFWSWDDGFNSVLEKPWSQVLEALEPTAQKAVDSWQTKLKDY